MGLLGCLSLDPVISACGLSSRTASKEPNFSHIGREFPSQKSGQSVSWSSVPSLTQAQQVHSVASTVLYSWGCLSSGSHGLDSLSMERFKTIMFSNPHNHFLLINTTVKLVIDTYWKSGWEAAVQRKNYFICSQRGHSQVGNDNSSVQKDKQVNVLRKKYQMTNCALRHSSNVLSLMVSTFPFPHQNTWRMQ